MTNLVGKIKEQAVGYDVAKEQVVMPMCFLSNKPSNYAIKDLLQLQRDTITHIDASQFSGLYSAQRASSSIFKDLIDDGKQNWPNMLVDAAESGVKSVGKDVLFFGGLVNSFSILIKNKFNGKSWGMAGKSFLIDAAKETPFMGDAAGYAVESVIFKKKKDANENAEHQEFNLDLKEIETNAKTEAPKIAKKATLSGFRGFFRELPVAKEIFDVTEVLSETKGKKGLILAGQVLVADLAGRIPKAGKYIKMAIKKVPWAKKGVSDEAQFDGQVCEAKFAGDDLYYMPEQDKKATVEPSEVVAVNAKDSIALDVVVMPQKIDTISETEICLAQYVKQLRGCENGVDRCVSKRKEASVQVNTDSISASQLVFGARTR